MTRHRIFDPGEIPEAFWRRHDVQQALAHRDVGLIFRLFLNKFDDCTQTQLALITKQDRSDISDWVSGARPGQVSDIDVLTRIADGLQIPDQARLLLGLVPDGPVDIEVDLAGPWPDSAE